MIEEILIAYLAGKTEAGEHVYAERPDNIPPKYLMLEKIGGGSENYLKRSLVSVQSVTDSLQGGTLLDAARLNEEVKALMEELPTLEEISGCKLDSDYNHTDGETKEYRYQAVFEITHY